MQFLPVTEGTATVVAAATAARVEVTAVEVDEEQEGFPPSGGDKFVAFTEPVVFFVEAGCELGSVSRSTSFEMLEEETSFSSEMKGDHHFTSKTEGNLCRVC